MNTVLINLFVYVYEKAGDTLQTYEDEKLHGYN